MKIKKNLDVLAFLGKVLLWMPVTFALWYFVMPAIAFISAFIADAVLPLFADHVINAIEANGREIKVVTQFGGQSFPIAAMNFAYSFPFLLAMVLASPDTIVGKIKKYAISIIPLFLVVLWGVVFGTFGVLAFHLGQEVAQQLNTTSTTRLIISLGFQLGKLMIPPLAPIILWLYLYRDYARQLVPRLFQRDNID